jgi:hypothetical protein
MSPLASGTEQRSISTAVIPGLVHTGNSAAGVCKDRSVSSSPAAPLTAIRTVRVMPRRSSGGARVTMPRPAVIQLIAPGSMRCCDPRLSRWNIPPLNR